MLASLVLGARDQVKLSKQRLKMDHSCRSRTSYYFGVLDGSREVFEVFAEGLPAEPTIEQRELWRKLKNLYLAAKDSARETWQILEKFEQGLERRLA